MDVTDLRLLDVDQVKERSQHHQEEVYLELQKLNEPRDGKGRESLRPEGRDHRVEDNHCRPKSMAQRCIDRLRGRIDLVGVGFTLHQVGVTTAKDRHNIEAKSDQEDDADGHSIR